MTCCILSNCGHDLHQLLPPRGEQMDRSILNAERGKDVEQSGHDRASWSASSHSFSWSPEKYLSSIAPQSQRSRRNPGEAIPSWAWSILDRRQDSLPDKLALLMSEEATSAASCLQRNQALSSKTMRLCLELRLHLHWLRAVTLPIERNSGGAPNQRCAHRQEFGREGFKKMGRIDFNAHSRGDCAER